VGDALGAPVEFMSLGDIRAQFGPDGIRDFAPAYGRRGAITDDTQMTLFTAEGLLCAHNGYVRGACCFEAYVRDSYWRWLHTQGELPAPGPDDDAEGAGDDGEDLLLKGWLLTHRELHARRAPGRTCISALRDGDLSDFARPVNNSKGCGAVMRMALAGLVFDDPVGFAMKFAAFTHGHPTAKLAAAFFADLIADIVHGGADLRAAVKRSMRGLKTAPDHAECFAALTRAVKLADSADPTPENVERLGAGWIAEEALAIAVFCALTADDFESGVIAAVNHSGDSDSTGAITGNILGAHYGRSAIPDRWLKELELHDVIQEVADDLVRHFYGESFEQPVGDADKYPPM
jgi:ADP-ribosylglycohydrolase